MLDMVDGHPQVAVLVESLVLRVVGLLEAHNVEVALVHPPSLYLRVVRHVTVGDGEWTVIDLGDALPQSQQQPVADRREVVAAVALAERAVAVLVAHDEVFQQMHGQGDGLSVDVLASRSLAVSLTELRQFLAIHGVSHRGALAVQRVPPAQPLQSPLYGHPVALLLGTAADDHGLVQLVVAHPSVAEVSTHQIPEVLLANGVAQLVGIERVVSAEVQHRALPLRHPRLCVHGIAQIVVLRQQPCLLPLRLAESPHPLVALAVAGTDVEGVVVGAAYLVAEHRLHGYDVAAVVPLHRCHHLPVLVGMGQHAVFRRHALYRLQPVGGHHQRTCHEARSAVCQQVDVALFKSVFVHKFRPVNLSHVAEVSPAELGEDGIVGHHCGLLVEGSARLGVELRPCREVVAAAGFGVLSQQPLQRHAL